MLLTLEHELAHEMAKVKTELELKLHKADAQMLEEINQFLDGIASATKETAYKKFKANVPLIEQSRRAMSDRLKTLQLTSKHIQRL